MHPDEALETLRRRLTSDPFGPGSMSVYVTYTDGHTDTFHDILVPTTGDAIRYKDGRVEFEGTDRIDTRLYTLLNVRSLYTLPE